MSVNYKRGLGPDSKKNSADKIWRKYWNCNITCAAHYAASGGFAIECVTSSQILWKVSDSSTIFGDDEKTSRNQCYSSTSHR